MHDDPEMTQDSSRNSDSESFYEKPDESLELTQVSPAVGEAMTQVNQKYEAPKTPPQAISPYAPNYQAPPPSQVQQRQSAPVPPPRRKRIRRRGCIPSPGCLMGCFGLLGFFMTLLIIFGFVAYFQLSNRLEGSIDDLEASLNALDDPNNTSSSFESTFIYDRHGRQLWEIFGQGRRQRVELADIPLSVQQATIAVEDDDFYSNPGFDVQSNIRAIGQFFQAGTAVSGASTITQQLVRNVVFDPEYRAERSVQRKVEEIALATVLTQRMEKDDILELYLNTIYYGNLAYGIEAASQTYFGKPASELELHEAALLAGLPQLPAVIDPLNPDPTIQAQVYERQALILDLMVEEGYITEDEAARAKAQPLNYVSPDVPLQAPHFTLYAVDQLEELLASLGKPPEYLADGGLKVYTSVDLDWQEIAQNAAENTVNQLRDQHNLTNAAVVIIHPPSGEVLAMVGSVDYNNEAIDGEVNVATSMRQPGSTMKPFTYAATFEQGWDASTILWDTESNFPIQGQADYVPLDYDRRFHGPVRVRDALANSYNIPAVKAINYVSADYLISLLKRMGTTSMHDEPGYYGAGLALTLGGGDITLLEMTSNYATLARQGVYVPVKSILCVIDRNDNIIYQYENRCPTGSLTNQTRNEIVQGTPVLDPRITFIISDILADNNARTPAMGANSPLNTGSLLTSVKTGTTDSFRDNWTMGYTHDVAIGVWSGNSNNDPMIDISGLAGAAPIWNTIINDIYRAGTMPPSVLNPPPGVSQHQICNIHVLRDPATGCSQQTEWFLDSPPLIPDGQGNLVPVPQNNTQPPSASEFGPRLVEIDRGIFRVEVRPLNDLQKNVLLSQNPSAYVAPQYCLVPQEILGMVPDVQTLVFIAPPADPNHQRSAYQYAVNAGIPILPQFPCTGETINAFGPVAPGIVGQIISPTPGQSVSGNVPIYGVVDYPNDRVFDYYKVEVRGGPFPDWTTMGEVHHNEVLEPGVLETFFAESLPPGGYELRLWIQGEVPVDPYVIPINLTSP